MNSITEKPDASWDPRIPCPHDQAGVSHDLTLPDYHPLTKAEVETLARAAVNATGIVDYSRAVVRLCQGIPGMTCPTPADGEVAEICTWVERFMADMAEGEDGHYAPLSVLVRVLVSENREAETFHTGTEAELFEKWDALYREELDNISDGSHTFKELYQHRAALLIALMCQRPEISWWSTLHHDGTMPFRDYIIAGMQLPAGPITYHLRVEPWQQALTGSPVPYLDRAPEYDGHRPADVIDRLIQWAADTTADPGLPF